MAESLVISSSQFSSQTNENQFELSSATNAEDHLDDNDLIEFYDLDKCIRCVKKFEVESPKVALQFPDAQLCDSARVAQIIEEKADCKSYILADTSYGSCCVDEIAAEHVQADLIIHFGPACLSRTERIPVIFSFGKEKINVDHCCQSFQTCFPDNNSKILIVHDVVYGHVIDTIYSKLAMEYNSLVLASVNSFDDIADKKRGIRTSIAEESCVEDNIGSCDRNEKGCCPVTEVDDRLKEVSLNDDCKENNSYCRFGRTFTLKDGSSIEDYVVFYIGKESLTLTNHMMSYNRCQFYSYDPGTLVCRKETLNVNRLLMKRYYLIEKAKDAQVVGILIGTLGVASYLSVLNRIKKMLRQSGKKYYTFVVGKINPEKLANFMEIDMFVLIACPENSLINSQFPFCRTCCIKVILDDVIQSGSTFSFVGCIQISLLSDFYKPIITPFEIEIACTRAREWTGEYITDFQELLPGAAHHVDIDGKETEEDQVPDVSLISGQLRPAHCKQDDNNANSDSLVLRNQNTALSTQHHTSAAEFLTQRSWKGLEMRRGETPVTKAVEGRSGIASSYTHEAVQNQNK